MARRAPNQPTTEPTEATIPGGIPGGADGVLPDASVTIHQPGAAEASAASAPPAEPAAKVSRFRVMPGGTNKDGSWPILYANLRTDLKPGKILDTGSYDVDYLVSQGVKLEALGEF